MNNPLSQKQKAFLTASAVIAGINCLVFLMIALPTKARHGVNDWGLPMLIYIFLVYFPVIVLTTAIWTIYFLAKQEWKKSGLAFLFFGVLFTLIGLSVG